jgi:CheY-like chemotaxis protein
MAQAGKSLNGVRILVVEDNFLAAEVVRDLLESGGCSVVGPVGRIADALRLAENEALDGAILDVNLNGERCFPIALALRQRGVPFVFLTGYDDEAIIPVELRPARRLGKPVFGPQLMAVLAEVI